MKMDQTRVMTIVILLAFGLFALERETASELKVEIVQPAFGEVLTINKEVIVRSSIVPREIPVLNCW